MRRTKCCVRDEQKDPREDRVNFFLTGNSYNREAELTDLETTSRGLARASPLAGRSDNTAERSDRGATVSEYRSASPGNSDPEPSTSRGISKSVVKFSNRSSWTGSSILNKKNIDMGQNQSIDKVAHVELDDESSACSAEFRPRAQYILVGWDSFRSKLMLMLLILFVVWAVVYFPLLYLGY